MIQTIDIAWMTWMVNGLIPFLKLLFIVLLWLQLAAVGIYKAAPHPPLVLRDY